MKWPPTVVLGSLLAWVALTNRVLSWQDAETASSSGWNPSPTQPFDRYGRYRPTEPERSPQFDYVPPEPAYGRGYRGDWDPLSGSAGGFYSAAPETPAPNAYAPPLPEPDPGPAWRPGIEGYTGVVSAPTYDSMNGSLGFHEYDSRGGAASARYRFREPETDPSPRPGHYDAPGWVEPDASQYRFRGDQDAPFNDASASSWGRSGYRFRPLTSAERRRISDRAGSPGFRAPAYQAQRRSPSLPEQGVYGYEPDSWYDRYYGSGR
jgi:hypothetical protein